MAATFSITLDKNFRLDTGRKLEKISKSRDVFFSRGDSPTEETTLHSWGMKWGT